MSTSVVNTSLTECKTVFGQFDADNSGSWDCFEFAGLCGSIGIKATPRELRAAFAAINTSNSGEITFDEFMQFWQNPALDVNDTSLLGRLHMRLCKPDETTSDHITPEFALELKQVTQGNLKVCPMGPLSEIRSGLFVRVGESPETTARLQNPELFNLVLRVCFQSGSPDLHARLLQLAHERTTESSLFRVNWSRDLKGQFDVQIEFATPSGMVPPPEFLQDMLGPNPLAVSLCTQWSLNTLARGTFKLEDFFKLELTLPTEKIPRLLLADVANNNTIKAILGSRFQTDIQADIEGLDEFLLGDDVEMINAEALVRELFVVVSNSDTEEVKRVGGLVAADGSTRRFSDVGQAFLDFVAQHNRNEMKLPKNQLSTLVDIVHAVFKVLQAVVARDSVDVQELELRFENGFGVEAKVCNYKCKDLCNLLTTLVLTALKLGLQKL